MWVIGEAMDDRLIAGILIILYPFFILIALLLFIPIYGYFIGGKEKFSKKSFDHRIRK